MQREVPMVSSQFIKWTPYTTTTQDHSCSPLLNDGRSNPQTYIINSRMDKKNIKEELYGKDYKTIGDHPNETYRLKLTEVLDNFDWAALGIAACGIVLFIHLMLMYIGKV